MARAGPFAIRALVLLTGLAVVLLMAAWRNDRAACNRAGVDVFLRRTGPIGPLDDALERVHADCRGTFVLLASSAALRTAGRYPRAAELARRATRKEPENFVAWADLYAALAPIDPKEARVARKRAIKLNPLSARGR
jgi:hypothetical protein